MRPFFFICCYWILFATSSCLESTSQKASASSSYQQSFENVIVASSSLSLFHETIVDNPITCHMECQRHPDKCFLLQTILTSDSGGSIESYVCSLFDASEPGFGVGSIKELFQPFESSPSQVSVMPAQRDCMDWLKLGFAFDGVYQIMIPGAGKDNADERMKVYCDMTTDGGGWTLVQKRFDGSVCFNRMWNEYKHGFGDVYGEHWIGNEFLHNFTTENNKHGRKLELIISAKRFNGETNFAKYEGFNVGDETSKYHLSVGQFADGQHEALKNDGVSERVHFNGASFSSPDQDNDSLGDRDCGKLFQSGFWFGDCFSLNINGVYRNTEKAPSYGDGVIWETWTKSWFVSLKETKMMVRRKSS